MKKSYKITIISVFLAFISVFFVLFLALPDKGFSERENRYLSAAPKFTFKALFNGDFTEKFESYTTDQFPLRDAWITLKARCERLFGKKENNGVFYGSDGYLLEAFHAPSDAELAERVGYVNALADRTDVPVYFGLIPGSVEIEAAHLPPNAPTDSQRDVIDKAYAASEVTCIDLYSALNAHKDDYIFYRTDHHWTSLGAYWGYAALCKAWSLPCRALADYEPETVSESFYGTTYSSSGFSWVAPDSMDIYVADDDAISVVNYSTGTAETGVLYDREALEHKDKYALFLGGNTPRVDIKSGHEGEKLLILRDSFADSLLPFLLDDFSEITLLDMRYWKTSVAQLIAQEGYDRVLVLYSVSEFCEDANLFMMSY